MQAKDRSQWQKDIAEVAKRKNVVCKVSGIVASAEPGKWTADDLAPIVNHTMDVFGPDRVMFGGDWPVCTKAATYKQWVEALKTIVADRTPEAAEEAVPRQRGALLRTAGVTPGLRLEAASEKWMHRPHAVLPSSACRGWIATYRPTGSPEAAV